jgi:hypothetical protein
MKKMLSSIFLAAFMIIAFSGKSWAFGWLGHHHNGQNDSSQYGSNDGSNDGSGDNGGPGSNIGSGGDGNNNNFPAAPAPEPMTLTLLGTGLAGIFLKRKIR